MPKTTMTTQITPPVVIAALRADCERNGGSTKPRYLVWTVLRTLGYNNPDDAMLRRAQRKIARVLNTHPQALKEGWNRRHGYTYLSEQDVADRAADEAHREEVYRGAQKAATTLGLSPKRVHHDGTLRLEPEELVWLANRLTGKDQ